MWTVHDNITIFITFIAPDLRAVSCDMSWFLTLETAILFVQYHINCGRGMIIAMSCCAALSFFTYKMASVSV